MRDRRTAEAEQAEDTNNIILTCCVVPTFANSHGISQRCSLVGQQGMNSAKGEGHPAAHSTAGSSCEGAAQQQAISGAATIHWVLRGGQHRGPVHQGCKQAGPGPSYSRAHSVIHLERMLLQQIPLRMQLIGLEISNPKIVEVQCSKWFDTIDSGTKTSSMLHITRNRGVTCGAFSSTNELLHQLKKKKELRKSFQV